MKRDEPTMNDPLKNDVREKLAKQFRDMYWNSTESGDICKDDLKIADWILAREAKIVEPLVELESEIDAIRVDGTYEQVQAHFNNMRRNAIQKLIKTLT